MLHPPLFKQQKTGPQGLLFVVYAMENQGVKVLSCLGQYCDLKYSKIISVSNSAYYRGLDENKTLDQAVGRLGLKTTAQYVDAICNRMLYDGISKKFSGIMDRLWEHSLACAYASQTVSEKLKLETHEDAFTLGMLHDIGKLVILKILSEMDNKGAFGEDADSIELFNSLEGYHGQFGKALLKMWGFSDEFGRVSMHHESLEGVDPISNSLLAVHFANLLVKAMGYGQEEAEEIDVENAESTRFLKIELTMISEIEQEVKLLVDDVKESIG